MSDKQAYRCLCFRRMFNLKIAEPPEDIVKLFNRYSDHELMTVENLQKFLEEIQGEGKDASELALKIFREVRQLSFVSSTRRGLNLDDFFRYLFGDLNEDLNPALPLKVHHDMTAPLAHYFIYTGHNSYLHGNQLCSPSGTWPIIRALKSGVRVIELDLWPNSKGDDIQVYHGKTLTSSVKLIKCLEAIRDNAFNSTSEYPVIITFEDHLVSSLQKKVAQMVKATFGNMLYPNVEFFEKFPPPESKKKILISTKLPEKSADDPEKVKDPNDVPISLESEMRSENTNELDKETKSAEMDKEVEEEAEAEAVEDAKYESLIAIHAIKGKGGLEKLLKGNPNRVARLSLRENKLKHAVEAHRTDIIRFTRSNLLRVYPEGYRVDSSNYDPLIAWTHGAQMVAFNMQSYDEYLWVMQGMFRANGGCGYVKKPDILLKDGPQNEVFNPSSPGGPKKNFKVKVYMGNGWHLQFRKTHFDKCSPPDFFVKLQIHGVKDDENTRKTKPLRNQWVPEWNEEHVFQLRVPELALLRIEVREHDVSSRDDFAGQTCLPVSELRSGIRAIPLYDKKGNKYPHVKLLMRFQLTEPTDC